MGPHNGEILMFKYSRAASGRLCQMEALENGYNPGDKYVAYGMAAAAVLTGFILILEKLL